MDKSQLDKLIRLYREGYISRDELIAHSKKAILKKDKSTRQRTRPHPSTNATSTTQSSNTEGGGNRYSHRASSSRRTPVSAPIQAIIDLDTPPPAPAKNSYGDRASNTTVWNAYSRGNPLFASMIGGVLIAMAIVAVLVVAFDNGDSEPVKQASHKPTANQPAKAAIESKTSNKNRPVSSSRRLSSSSDKLKSVASEFEQSTIWPANKISEFQSLWNSLPAEEKKSLKNTHWFKTFSLVMTIQLSQLHSLSAEQPDNKSLRVELKTLRNLSVALGNTTTAFDDPIIKTRRNIRISDVDIEPLPNPSDTSENVSPSQSTEMSSATGSPADDSGKQAPAKEKPIKLADISRLPELENLLSKYIAYYENGNLDNIVKLFSGSGWHQGQIGDFELRESYRETFNQTLQRKMLIENLHWSFKGTTALATGRLTLRFYDRENQQAHEQHGSIRLVATLRNNEFRFSNLYHILQ